MSKIRLYIENKEVELSNDIEFAITKQFDDFNDPTAIINDWSKTVEIPFTKNNNELFGYLYNPNRITVAIKDYTDELKKEFVYSSEDIDWDDDTHTFHWLHQIPMQESRGVIVSILDDDDNVLSSETYNTIGHHKFTFAFSRSLGYKKLRFKFEQDYIQPELIFDISNFVNFVFSTTFDIFIIENGRISVGNILIYQGSQDYKWSDTKELSGIYFDPNKKLNFRLERDDEIIMSGYAKTNSITRSNGFGSYNITLNGTLGQVFQELQKITTNEEYEDKKYYIGDLVNAVINKNLVWQSWNNEPKFELDDNPSATDIIGFAPVNYLNKNFDSKNLQSNYKHIRPLKEQPLYKWSTNPTVEQKFESEGYDVESFIGNGIEPRSIGEFRSYYQQPFIYVNKMFQLLKKKCLELTGYNLILDPTWFSEDNPYYSKMVMLLRNLANDVEESEYSNIYDVVESRMLLWDKQGHYDEILDFVLKADKQIKNEAYPDMLIFDDIDPRTVRESFAIKNDSKYVLNIHPTLKFNFTIGDYRNPVIGNRLQNYIDIIVRYTGVNGYVETDKYIVCDDGFNPPISGSGESTESVIRIGQLNNDGTVASTIFEVPTNHRCTFADFGSYVNISYIIRWHNNIVPVQAADEVNPIARLYLVGNSVELLSVTVGSHRSNSTMLLKELFDKDSTLFSKCLQYTKMFNLKWICDDVNKTLRCVPQYTYLSEKTNKIEDITGNIDMGKDFIITPVVYNNKYMLFNYKSQNSDISKIYKEETGYEYGEKRLVTNYAFNNETKSIFKDIPVSIVNSPAIINWGLMMSYKGGNIYTQSGENMLSNCDKDKKPISGIGQFYFCNNMQKFNDKILTDCETIHYEPMSEVWITDDTKNQIANKLYTYIDKKYAEANGLGIKTEYYNELSNVWVDDNKYYLSLFAAPTRMYLNIPEINYTEFNNKGIYDLIWKKFIEGEMLNVNTIMLTCDIKTNTFNINDFIGSFVIVDKCLYLVNKIYDYSPLSNTTKCDLIRVNNLSNYTSSNLA